MRFPVAHDVPFQKFDRVEMKVDGNRLARLFPAEETRARSPLPAGRVDWL
jgi:hypothetical protein